MPDNNKLKDNKDMGMSETEIENGIDFSIFDNDLSEEEIKEIKEKQKIAKEEILKERKREEEEKKIEWKRKLSESHKGIQSGKNNPMYGKHHSNETKNKLSKSHIGKLAGENHPMYGKHHSEETRERISNSKKGKKSPNYGKPMSEEQKEKISESLKGLQAGEKHHMYGKHHSDETRSKLSLYTGEKSSNWHGGISFLPYCQKFNGKLKRAIRNRDNHTCQLCYCKENGEKHSVHHIHYDKENCYPDLITLCRGCNAKVNKNRNYYENLFMNKLNDRGLLYWTRKISGC